MDINRDNMDVFFEELRVAFTEGFNAPRENNILTNVAMTVPSATAQTVHAWLNQIPQMREWLGDRQKQDVQSNKLTVANRKFEDTIPMKREEIEDDLHRLYIGLSQLMGNSADAFRDELLIEALLRGTSDEWVDEVAVFSNAGRTYGDNTIDNYNTVAFDAAGVQLNAVYTKMVSYLGQQNKPLRVRPRWLIHGPELRSATIAALEKEYTAILNPDASTYVQGNNTNMGLLTRVETPYLVDGYVDSLGNSYDAASYWYVVAEIGGIRGLAYQDRKGPEIQTSRLSDESDHVFENDEYQFGVRMRGAAFVTLPHLVFANVVA